jgi:hypothetical protein
MKAQIEGKPVEIEGYDEQGHLVLADGTRYEITPLEMDTGLFRTRTSRSLVNIWKLAREGKGWFLDGRSLDEMFNEAKSTPRTSECDSLFHSLLDLKLKLEDMDRKNCGSAIVAVAWTEEDATVHEESNPRAQQLLTGRLKEDNKPKRKRRTLPLREIEIASPGSKTYHPVFLRCFHRQATKPTDRQREEQERWFTSYEDAARYVGRNERTIRNWITRDWLSCEKNGQKVRISSRALDKSAKRQPQP